MKNKVVIITGASSGIGKATAILFAKSGALTVVAARNYEKLTSIADELIKRRSCTVLPVKTDVQKEDDCRNLIQQTLAHFHKIDVLINNAGISMRAIFEEVDLSVVKKVMDVNFMNRILHQVCNSLFTKKSGLNYWNFLNCRFQRIAWKNCLFGFQVCHAWVFRGHSFRKSRKGLTCFIGMPWFYCI